MDLIGRSHIYPPSHLYAMTSDIRAKLYVASMLMYTFLSLNVVYCYNSTRSVDSIGMFYLAVLYYAIRWFSLCPLRRKTWARVENQSSVNNKN